MVAPKIKLQTTEEEEVGGWVRSNSHLCKFAAVVFAEIVCILSETSGRYSCVTLSLYGVAARLCLCIVSCLHSLLPGYCTLCTVHIESVRSRHMQTNSALDNHQLHAGMGGRGGRGGGREREEVGGGGGLPAREQNLQ